MTTSAPTLTFDNSTDAAFRAWGSGISTALAAVGLVQTSDTGQINWTTVTRPLTNNTVQGYEIWRFNDTLQSTRPIFIKIEYGGGAATVAAANPSLWFTVGAGTNGAGTLTTTFTTRREISNTSSGSAFPGPLAATCYVASDTGYLTLVWPYTTNFGWSNILHMSRTCGANGVDNGDGFQTLAYGSSSNSVMTWTTYSFMTGQALSDMSLVLFSIPYPAGFNTAVSGSDTYFFPQVINLPKQEWSNGLMTAYTADVANLTTYSVPNNGGTHTYLAYTSAGIGMTNHCMLFRYE